MLVICPNIEQRPSFAHPQLVENVSHLPPCQGATLKVLNWRLRPQPNEECAMPLTLDATVFENSQLSVSGTRIEEGSKLAILFGSQPATSTPDDGDPTHDAMYANGEIQCTGTGCARVWNRGAGCSRSQGSAPPESTKTDPAQRGDSPRNAPPDRWFGGRRSQGLKPARHFVIRNSTQASGCDGCCSRWTKPHAAALFLQGRGRCARRQRVSPLTPAVTQLDSRCTGSP